MKKLKKTAPILSQIKRENVFRVPDGYFEEFPGKMMQRIGNEGERQQVIRPGRKLFKPQFAVAAAILAFAVLGYLSLRYLFTDSTNQELSPQEIAEYIEYYASDLDEGLYYEVLDDIEVDESANREYEKLVIDYLIDQGIDYASIIENL